MARPPAGYVIPEGAKSYDDWQKCPKAESWICDESGLQHVQQHYPDLVERLRNEGWVRVGMQFLTRTQNCSAVADFLNGIGVPTGPYCRKRKKWYGAMVRRYYSNPILKGFPARGTKHTINRHETGRRISVKNPKGPTYRECSHLAFLTAGEFDDLAVVFRTINSRFKVQAGQRPGSFNRCSTQANPFPWPVCLLLVLRPALCLGCQWHHQQSAVLRFA